MRQLLTTGAVVLTGFLSATTAPAAVVGVFHENLVSGNNTLFVFGAAGTEGTISGGSFATENFTIGADGVFVRSFGISGNEMTSNGTVNTLSFRVDSASPVSALALNRGSASTDMTVLLDEDALGSDYVLLTTPGVFGDGSQMSVTATANDTVVTITPSITLAGNPAGVPFNVVLQAGESIFYESGGGNDLSGTRVTSTSPVAVFGGAECTQVPVGTIACDHLISQQFSTDNFDTRFNIVENFGAGTAGDLIRVTTATDNTEIFIDGVSQGTINAGEVLQIDGVSNSVLTSSAPVTVGQFTRGQGGTRSTGDPAFAIIPSVDQQLKEYAFATPIGGDSFSQNFLNIAIGVANAATLMLNGVSVDTSGFENIGGILFGNVSIDPGFGVVSAASEFLATISGFSGFDSYFTPIATAFSPGVSPPPPPPDPDPSPVPLPAAGWMLLAGLGALAAARRRKRA